MTSLQNSQRLVFSGQIIGRNDQSFSTSLLTKTNGKFQNFPMSGLHKFILGKNDQSLSILLFDSRDQSFPLILNLWRLVIFINYDLCKTRGFQHKLGFLSSLSWPLIVEQRLVILASLQNNRDQSFWPLYRIAETSHFQYFY